MSRPGCQAQAVGWLATCARDLLSPPHWDMPGQDRLVQQTVARALFPECTLGGRGRQPNARLPTRPADPCMVSCALLLSLPAHAKLIPVAHPPTPAWGKERHCQGSCHHVSVSQRVCPHALPTVMLLSHAHVHMLGEAHRHMSAPQPCCRALPRFTLLEEASQAWPTFCTC